MADFYITSVVLHRGHTTYFLAYSFDVMRPIFNIFKSDFNIYLFFISILYVTKIYLPTAFFFLISIRDVCKLKNCFDTFTNVSIIKKHEILMYHIT